MVTCLTSSRFNMLADVLRQDARPAVTNFDVTASPPSGYYDNQQDPLTGQIKRVWVAERADDPTTPEDEAFEKTTIKCIARGVIDGGIRVAGTTERFGENYENIDYVKLSYGKGVVVTKRDRITNIRNRKGDLLWQEEESGLMIPSVFNVLGVTPVIDPFGAHVENFVMLERAEL